MTKIIIALTLMVMSAYFGFQDGDFSKATYFLVLAYISYDSIPEEEKTKPLW